MSEQQITFRVNKQTYRLGVSLQRTLLEVLREDLSLTGTKCGCGQGECGACTVLVDGKATLSCLTLAAAMDGKEITTIEGLTEDDKLSPLQEAFINYGAIQCGFCTPAMILTAKALLDENPHPTEEDVRDYLRGTLCRCTGYIKIIEAIVAAGKEM
jgi:carbon-monoxide dehydrogenase small subunit